MNKPFFITTSIVYVNANPHLGFAMELAQADFLARYTRSRGEETYFLTGVDEHGLKIHKAAETAGQDTQAFVDGKAEVVRSLVTALGLSNDRFVRTSEAEHKTMAQALWRMCAANGDIYKKKYRAWYNVKEEEFLGLVDEHPDPSVFGVDPKFIEKIEEENYFFALSKYADQIIRLLKGGEYQVVPDFRAQELINFVESRGLQDVSISREKEKLAWGVPVPDDDTQVMYVWFDALSNYLTASCSVDDQGRVMPGERWPADVHCVGKDISRFHGLLWPGMLLSAGLPLPKRLLVHGFISSDGQKMSKSLGNVVDPLPMIEEYGVDAVRWFLLKEIPTTGDGDFTLERFRQTYQADLANDLGNLASRVWTMCQKYVGGAVPQVTPEQVENLEKAIVEEKWHEYDAAVADFKLHEALQAAQALLVFSNRRIDERKPWVLAKDAGSAEELAELLYELLEILRHVSIMIAPAMPGIAERIQDGLFAGFERVGDRNWGVLPAGHTLGTEQPILFPRLEKAE